VSAWMLSAASGARPRLVCTSTPVALMTGVMRDARSCSRLERMLATIASGLGMAFGDRSACRCRRTACTTTGAGRPVSPSVCRILSTEGIARKRAVFTQGRLYTGRPEGRPLPTGIQRQASIDTVARSEPLINFQAPCVSPPATTMWISEGSKILITSSDLALRREA